MIPNEKASSKKRDQISKTFKSFYQFPKTMKEVSVETGIMRPNICRYVSMLKKSGKIFLLKKRHCRITRHIAGEYTTNPALFRTSHKQLSIFD